VELIDIGVNLAHKRFAADLPELLERAHTAGVAHVIATGTSVVGSRRALELARRFAGRVTSTAGIHPHNAREFSDATAAALRSLARESAVVAIGECGLDYDRDFSPRPKQRECFEAQLSLARELGLPVFLHQREAHHDFCSILADSGVAARAVVHCFTGSGTELEAYLELGCFIGITGYICDERRGAHLLELVSRIPSERLMLETDAPFLLPRDLRPPPPGKRNEPSLLPHILEVVARCRGEEPRVLAQRTTTNARSFFALDSGERWLERDSATADHSAS